jgi:hypothetical protein
VEVIVSRAQHDVTEEAHAGLHDVALKQGGQQPRQRRSERSHAPEYAKGALLGSRSRWRRWRVTHLVHGSLE